jgi:hypothetical protein
MPDQVYNQWRQDISCEYILRTFKSFPKMGTAGRKRLARRLVELADMENPLNPVDAVNQLILENLV